MKAPPVLIFLLLLCSSLCAGATQQESDDILFEGARCELETGWVFSSPLEIFYRLNPALKYPFEPASTANYRGHKATWQIADQRLYLVEVDPRGPSLDPPSDQKPAARDLGVRGQELVKKLFPRDADKDGRVFARWFSGNLRIFGRPEKRIYKEPQDREGREIVEFTTITLLQLKDGVVTRETSFSRDEYWKKFETFLAYRKIAEKETAAIAEHLGFLDQQQKDWESIGSIEPDGPARTERDFSVFLTRYVTNAVKIPLTKCEIVKDTSTDFTDQGWIIDSDLRIAPGNHLLMLEMNSSPPEGPWSDFTGGSVQVLVQLGRLESKEITFSEKDTSFFRFINNFSGVLNPKQQVSGKLNLLQDSSGKVTLDGSIQLTSQDPASFQEIVLAKQSIPVLGLKEYVERHNPNPKEGSIASSASEILKRIREQSGK